MHSLTHLQPKHRTTFKRTITSLRCKTQTQPSPNINMTLSQVSFKKREKEQTKKIHTLPKQTFITHKKQFLLSRKLFFSNKHYEQGQTFNKPHIAEPSPHNQQKPDNQYKNPSYDQLMNLQLVDQQQVFDVNEQIMKNAFTFHRNMISKIKDDQGTKNILKRWYHNHVESNLKKLKKIQNYEQQKLEFNRKSSSYIELQQRLKHERNQKALSQNGPVAKVNENNLKKDHSASTTPSKKSQASVQLTKLIVRIQPFLYKVRIKI